MRRKPYTPRTSVGISFARKHSVLGTTNERALRATRNNLVQLHRFSRLRRQLLEAWVVAQIVPNRIQL
jgi:hypothetical protein